jgi:hypothetical protein
LLRRPDVSARVEELRTAVAECQLEKISVDRALVMAMLIENVERAMEVEPVRDRAGQPIVRYIYQGGVANKALELLGKELGMFQPQRENSMLLPDLAERWRAGRQRALTRALGITQLPMP